MYISVGVREMWMCAGANHVEVRRQTAEGVFSFLNAEPRGEIWVIQLGDKPLACYATLMASRSHLSMSSCNYNFRTVLLKKWKMSALAGPSSTECLSPTNVWAKEQVSEGNEWVGEGGSPHSHYFALCFSRKSSCFVVNWACSPWASSKVGRVLWKLIVLISI